MGCKPFNSVSKTLTTFSWGGRGGVNSLTKIFIKMHKKLFRIIDALDNKFDIEIEQYFKLTKEEREELAQIISQSLLNNSNKISYVIHSYIVSINSLIKQLEAAEEYEKCDLFRRIEKKLFDSIEI